MIQKPLFSLWVEEYHRDIKIDEAKQELVKFFTEKNENAFHMQQLEVFFEKQFFHWITAKAINELIADDFLRSEEVSLRGVTELSSFLIRSTGIIRGKLIIK